MSAALETIHTETPLNEAGQTPLKELLSLALPTVAQMVSYTLMQFIDTWMLARKMGPMAPTAASNAGSLSFAIMGLGFGMILVVNTLVSQNYGQKNYAHCGRHLWQGVWFGLMYAAFMICLIPIVPKLFVLFGHEPQVWHMEQTFMRVMLASSGLKLVQTAFSQFMLGTNRPRAVLASTVIGLTVNALAAYIMVFGALGVRPMGVLGAALGQVCGMFVEMATLIGFAMHGENRAKFNTLDWRLRAAEFKTLIKIGFGSGLQLFAEVLAWALFMNIVMAQLGTNAMAAMALMLRYLIVSFLPAAGVGSAVTSLVGRYIGMKKPEQAMHRAHLGFKVTLCYFAANAGVYIFWRHELIRFFTTEPEVVRLGGILLVFTAFYQVFDGMYIIYVGALRGAGDTFIPAIVTAALCWGIMFGGGYFMAHNFPQLSVAGPWGIGTVYGIILGFFMLHRFHKGKWRKIHIEDDEQTTTRGFEVTQPIAAH